MSGMPESNVEKLLMAILTKDPSYVVKPESRIEALLLAIYETGGSGGGGGAFKSGTVKTCVLKDTPVYGYKVGDKYIDFVLNTEDEEEEQHVYVLVSDLVDDKAIGISYDNAVSKLKAENIQAAIDELVASKLDVDDELSDISENPVQNKVVKEAIDSLITLPDTTAEVGQMVKVKTIGSDNKPSEFEYGNIPEMTAENVSYDNSKSEIEAENVQDAIDSMKDEFYSELEDVNTSIESKANADEVYTKAETYAKTEVYTKTQTDTAITNKVAEIVADAPEDFDTLKEMSDWISNHEESAAAMNTAIAGKITAPSTATVGQILSVKAVDTSGKPTEWECVEKGGDEPAPSGGDFMQWFLIDFTHTISWDANKVDSVYFPNNGSIVYKYNGSSPYGGFTIKWSTFYNGNFRITGASGESTSASFLDLKNGVFPDASTLTKYVAFFALLKSDVEKYNIQQITK